LGGDADASFQLRYLASTQNNLNVGIDVAYRDDETGAYFRIGETF
jgi:hypothetical protein